MDFGPVTFVSASSYADPSPGSTPTTLPVPAPAGIVSGDFLLALMYDAAGASSTCVAPAGWNVGASNVPGDTSGNAFIFWKIAGGSEPSTYDFVFTTAGGDYACGAILQYKFVNAVTPFDGSPAFTDYPGGALDYILASLIAGASSEMLVAAAFSYNGSLPTGPMAVEGSPLGLFVA